MISTWARARAGATSSTAVDARCMQRARIPTMLRVPPPAASPAPRCSRRRSFLQRGFEAPEQLALRGIELFPCLGEREPGAAVHFGVREPAARAPRPFDRRGVAGDGGRVGVAFTGPGMHGLAGLLANTAQRQERPVGRETGLLAELPARGLEQWLAFADQPLRDGPGPGIPSPPEGAAG